MMRRTPTQGEERISLQMSTVDLARTSFESPRPSRSSPTKRPVTPIYEDSPNTNRTVELPQASPPPSPPSELPYHRPVSTLVIDSSPPSMSPMSESRTLMPLTVANPDIVPPRTPTPPRPTELPSEPEDATVTPKAQDLNPPSEKLPPLPIRVYEQDANAPSAESRPRYTRDSGGRLERIRDEETDTWRASRGSSENASHTEPTSRRLGQFVSRTTVPLKSNPNHNGERDEVNYGQEHERRHSRGRDSRHESDESHRRRSIASDRHRRRDRDRDREKDEDTAGPSREEDEPTWHEHPRDRDGGIAEHHRRSGEDERHRSSTNSPSKHDREPEDQNTRDTHGENRSRPETQERFNIPVASSSRRERERNDESRRKERDRDRDRDREDRHRRREEREKEREERQRARERAIAESSNRSSRSRRSSRDRRSGDEESKFSSSKSQTSPLVIRNRGSRDPGESSAAESSSTPQDRNSIRVLPVMQHSSSSSDYSIPPVSGVTRPAARRKQPSAETIPALGKEWEVVPEPSRHHRSRSRPSSRTSTDQDKLKEAVRAVVESSSSGTPSHRKSIGRQVIKTRRSLSADSLLTSVSRAPPTVPPTPPVKSHPPHGSRPPTASRPSVSRRSRSRTPSSRGSTPSPTLDKPMISSPVSIQRARARSHANAPESPSHPSPTSLDARSPKPSSSAPRSSNSLRRNARDAPVPSDDVTRPMQDSRDETTNDRDPERVRRGQSWSVTDAAKDEDRRLQLHLAVIQANGQKAAESPNSASVPTKMASVARAGSSHTSFKLHAPLVPVSASRNYGTTQPHPPERAATVHATNPNGYYTQSPYYSHAVSRAQTPDTYYSHFQYANSPGASPYSNPSALQAYQPNSTSRASASPYQYAHMLAYTASSSATHLPSSTPPNASNLNAYPSPQQSSVVNGAATPATYVQFSSRASYPIAPYPLSTSTQQWSNQQSPTRKP